MKIEFELPWPPSVNTYWRRKGNIYFISKQGRDFRKKVDEIVKGQRLAHGFIRPLAVDILASPPDKRIRDLDNLLKSIFDSLTHAGVYRDDSQIDQIRIARLPPPRLGRVHITIEEIGGLPGHG